MKKITKAVLLVWTIAVMGFATVCSVSAKDSEGDVVIVIDAGHGGNDPGSTSTVTGANEKDCNLAIAKAMKDEIGKYDGVKVYLTRSGDDGITNSGRANIAATLHADFLISIHNNSGSDTGSGCIGYRSLNEIYAGPTEEMCRLITDNLAGLGFANGGVQTRVSTQFDYEDYYTLIAEGVRAGVPSVIIEHCYLSNPEDAGKLTNSDGTVNGEMAAAMGKADAAAVVSYFNLSKRTTPADSATELLLTRGNSAVIEIPGQSSDGATWTSSDESVVTVDENGLARAVGSGTARVTYGLSDGTDGFAIITVPEVTEVALTGAINPTFYDDVEDMFSDIDLGSAYGMVTYSDGTSAKVELASVSDVDTSRVGIQYLDITYGNLTGRLMVCHDNADYKPEVTEPETTEANTMPQTMQQTEPETASQTEKAEKPRDNDMVNSLIKFVVVLLVLVIIAIVLVVIERNRQSKWNGRR